jgi:hypothetical protein
VRFFAQWERVTAAVAAPRRFLLSVCVPYGSFLSAVPSASQKYSHMGRTSACARGFSLSRRARINKVASTIGRRHVSLPRVRTLNTSVRHVPQAQRCLSRHATQFKGYATVGTKR